MMPLTAIIMIKARLLERLLAIIGSLKILIIKFLPKMVKTLLREDQQLYIRSVWAGSQPPAFAAQPHALVRL